MKTGREKEKKRKRERERERDGEKEIAEGRAGSLSGGTIDDNVNILRSTNSHPLTLQVPGHCPLARR